jgi:hypothetical protein
VALHSSNPTPDEMKALGLEPEDYANDTYEVWSENWPAWCLYMQIAGQWRMAMMASVGGAFSTPCALDYNVLFVLLDRKNLKPDEWQQMFDDIRVIEGAALDTMNKQNSRRK